MISLPIILQNLKLIGAFAAVIAIVWVYKDNQHLKAEKAIQQENASNMRRYDSLRYSSQILSTSEINEYLRFQNADLKKKLDQAGIKPKQLQTIINHNYRYQDTTKRETDLSKIADAIKANIPAEQEVVDTLNCWTTRGIISYRDNQLKWQVIDRQFTNKTDATVYWQRRQWNFLGIKTRFLGKKEYTSKIFDACGESKIMKIEKKSE